jgi:hypothetical protein
MPANVVQNYQNYQNINANQNIINQYIQNN